MTRETNGHHTPLTTAIAVLLDETGSMGSHREAAIAGFNDWLAAQQALADPCTLTLAKFSLLARQPLCRIVHAGVPIREVRPLDGDSYRPDGTTPLYDAIGETLVALDRGPRSDRTLVVILTDGHENASRAYTQRQVHDMIREREAAGTWTFLYLGAHADVWAVGEALGTGPDNTVAFHASEVQGTFDRLAASTVSYRAARATAAPRFWKGRTPGAPPA